MPNPAPKPKVKAKAKTPVVLTAAQQELVSANIGLVKVVAMEVWRKLPPHVRPTIDADEIIQAGMLGIISAVQRYDPSRGAFSKFANWRIKGECIEFLRKHGRWMSGANSGQRSAPTVATSADELVVAAPTSADTDSDSDTDVVALIPPRMSASQRAAYAVALLPPLRRAARARKISALLRGQCSPVVKKISAPGRARDFAAQAVGVNPLYVSHAVRISKDAPDLFQRLLAGELSISAALHTLRARRKTG